MYYTLSFSVLPLYTIRFSSDLIGCPAVPISEYVPLRHEFYNITLIDKTLLLNKLTFTNTPCILIIVIMAMFSVVRCHFIVSRNSTDLANYGAISDIIIRLVLFSVSYELDHMDSLIYDFIKDCAIYTVFL